MLTPPITKYFIFLVAFWSAVYCVNAQAISAFTINGTINSDTGKMILMTIADTSYYPTQLRSLEAKIIKGKFIFKGSVLYPHAFMIGLETNNEWKYLSDIFYIEKGEQNILCNADSLREIPLLTNMSMEELKNKYLLSFNSVETALYKIEKKDDSLKHIYKNNVPQSFVAELASERNIIYDKRDSILLQYTIEHPNSYVALWKFANKFSDGYKEIYDSIYMQFSDSLKHTYTGMAIAQKLNASGVAAVGKLFPLLPLLDTTNVKYAMPQIDTALKFTLIDFWFSHCTPCISQFRGLKIIYENYKKKGFEIIGISTDGEVYINDWKSVIKKYELPWKQYLDLNGNEANKLSIEKFPTNFLLNKDGKIIAKDILPFELDSFLKQNLK